MGLMLPPIEAYQVQHLPIVKAYADKIGLVEAINAVVPTEMGVDPGTIVLGIDIIANNPIDQKVVELCPSQHYSLVEHSMYRSVFPPQGVENGVFLPASPRASKAFADHDESDACGISAMARTFSVCLGSVCATTLC